MIYFDNAATTQPCAAAIEAAAQVLAGQWGNPSSFYSLGLEAERTLGRARRTVARALGAKEAELYFTSGGTEGNNLAVLGLSRARKSWGRRVVSTAYEHPSVENCLGQLESEGFEVVRVAPKGGVVDIGELLAAVTKETALVTAMAVNNETGALIDIPALAAGVKERSPRTAVHTDFVQGFCKRRPPITPDLTALTVSGHKINGPKGIGALYLKEGTHIAHVLHGGLQERSLRPGTENVAFAAAMAAAVSAHRPVEPAVRQAVLDGLRGVDGIAVNSPENGDSSILNLSLVGYRSETVLHFLEMCGIFVSSGSACSKNEKSHTLTAMGLPAARIDSALRVSFSGDSTVAEAQIFVKELLAAQRELAGVMK